MVDFPSGIKLLKENTKEGLPKKDIARTPMELGIGKTRRRSSAKPRKITIPLMMTDAEYTLLFDFYDLYPATIFNFTNPRTNTVERAKFASEPDEPEVRDGFWVTTIVLELLP